MAKKQHKDNSRQTQRDAMKLTNTVALLGAAAAATLSPNVMADVILTEESHQAAVRRCVAENDLIKSGKLSPDEQDVICLELNKGNVHVVTQSNAQLPKNNSTAKLNIIEDHVQEFNFDSNKPIKKGVKNKDVIDGGLKKEKPYMEDEKSSSSTSSKLKKNNNHPKVVDTTVFDDINTSASKENSQPKTNANEISTPVVSETPAFTSAFETSNTDNKEPNNQAQVKKAKKNKAQLSANDIDEIQSIEKSKTTSVITLGGMRKNSQETLSEQRYQGNTVVLSDIRISNLRGVKPETISSNLPIGIGSPYSSELNQSIENHLMGSGFFKSVQVSLKGTVLLIRVEENPRVAAVAVQGAKLINSRDIKKNLNSNNIGEGGVLNPTMLSEFGNELKKEYLNVGKENPKIDINYQPITEQDVQNLNKKAHSLEQLSENGTPMKINVNIDEGETTRIKEINFTGNTVFSSEQLKRKMTSSEVGIVPVLSQGSRFSHSQLHSDLDGIVNEYKDIGFANASIPNVSFEDVGTPDKPLKKVNVVISEGQKYLFGKPEFLLSDDAKELLDQKTLIKLNTIKVGKTFNKTELMKTQRNIENHLKNQGRAFAKIDINFKESETNDGLKVFIPQYHITAFQEAVIRHINIHGVNKTKKETVAKELRQKAGDVFNQRALEVSNTKLQQTGFYNNVDMQVKPVSTDNNTINAVDLDVSVTERRTGNATVSAGYMQGSGLTLGAAISDRNAFGSGKAVGADVAWSKPSKQVNLNYSDPHLFGQDKNLDVNIYGSDYNPSKVRNNNNDYRLKRIGTNITAGIPVFDFNKIYFGIGAERMDLKTFGNAPLQYRKFISQHSKDGNTNHFKGNVIKGTVGYSIDKTTNPYWGQSGFVANVNAEATFPVSDVKYVKTYGSYKHFFPLSKNATLMLHGQAGWGKGLGKGTKKDLPFFHTFQAGGIGGTPVRAFDVGSLGPKVHDSDGNVITLGGSNMLGFTAEANTKIPFVKDSTDMRVGVFVDVGSVWDNKVYTNRDSDNGRSVYKDASYKSSFKNELRAAAGVAYTWQSPIGAIKVSYGVPIRKRDGDQVQRVQFSLGGTF